MNNMQLQFEKIVLAIGVIVTLCLVAMAAGSYGLC